MQREFILGGLPVFVVLTSLLVIFGFSGFFSGANTGMVVSDSNSYQASLNGIGSTTVDFKEPKTLNKITASTCFNHRKTGDYYRFKFTAYAKKSTGYEARFSKEYPQAPNWFGGKGKKCHSNFVIFSPSAFDQIDRIVIEAIMVKGGPRFSANFQIDVKPVPAPSLPSPPKTTGKIDTNYALPQLPTPKVLPQQIPNYETISASISDFKLTQKGKIVDNNNIDYSIPLMVEFYIKNEGASVIYPYYQLKVDDYSYYEEIINLYKNGAQKVKGIVFYPKFPNLDPGQHIIGLSVLGTNYVQSVNVNFVGSKEGPKPSNKPPINAQGSLYDCPAASLGARCLMKNNPGQCREGFSRTFGRYINLTNVAGTITGKAINCVLIEGNLDGCENRGSDCELSGKRGFCTFKDTKNDDFRLRCFTDNLLPGK